MTTFKALIKVFNYLEKQYDTALSLRFINKPISYALYQTWKHFDSIEENRNDRTK